MRRRAETFNALHPPRHARCGLAWLSGPELCMKGLCFLGLALLAAAGAAAAEDSPWLELKGQHVIVRYQGSRSFADDVRRRAELDYDRIGRDLGFTRHGNFWLWDNRARIDVYATRDAYVAASQAPEWSAGKADYDHRAILTFEGSQSFLDSILPHEMTHLIFREFIGFTTDVPLWLDEGVAQWADVANRSKVNAIAGNMLASGRLLSVPALTQLDPRRGASGGEAIEFYAQASSLVGFIMESQGSVRFREFCGHLRDGHTVDDALRFTYPGTIPSLEALDSAWKAHLEEARDEQAAGRIYTH
ncbi:MAG: hypothetical protein K8T26_02800 [Lentisphaerae bacterium]|nr:hypothetical protein [Lentisphaerota bacterium]